MNTTQSHFYMLLFENAAIKEALAKRARKDEDRQGRHRRKRLGVLLDLFGANVAHEIFALGDRKVYYKTTTNRVKR